MSATNLDRNDSISKPNIKFTNSNAITNRPINVNLCYSCQTPINGQVITALGYLWHPEHFVCFHCNQTIGTSIFYEKDDKPYCEHDYLSLFSPKCAACSNPILDVSRFLCTVLKLNFL